MDFIARPFGALMEFIYHNLAFNNYGIAIIIFTIFVRLLMFPLSLKQQRSMEKQQELMPEIEAIKKNFKNDPRRMQEEQAKLFTKYKVSPYAGCLPMLIQLPIITTLFTIIRRPLTYIAGLSGDTISQIYEFIKGKGITVIDEIGATNFFTTNTSVIAEMNNELGINFENINMNFLKIFNLGETPAWNPSTIISNWKVYLPLLLIPVLALITTYLQQKISIAITSSGKKDDKKKDDPTAGMMNGMIKIMPLFTLVFAFFMPAGLGLYWIVGNIIAIGQTYLIKKVFVGKKKESI